MAACDQCGKPALVVVAKHPLCVGCYALLQQTENTRIEAANDQLRLLFAYQNHLIAEMDWMVGVGPSAPRTQIPAKPAPQYNTIHSVNVGGGSTVGAITTGSAQSIAVAIGKTQKQGNTDLAAALKAFTDALANDEGIPNSGKREMSEQLATLSEELTKPEEDRRRAVIGPMLEGLSKAVSVSTGLVSLWDRLHPLLTQALK